MPSSSEIARVMAEMDRFNKSVTVTEERYEKRVASVGGSYGGLTALLQQGAPGNWASDHKSEAEKFSGWHYVAITSIGKAVRSSDVEAYQEKVREYAKGYNEQDEDTTPLPKWHPLMKLLKRPNPSQSGASFREEMAIQLCLTGSALVWNVPNQMGRTVERYVIPTAIAEPRQPEKGLPKGGWYINPEVARWQIESGWFLYTGLATAIGKVIDARDVQVIRFIHPVFKDEGQSPVSAGALWTDTSEKIDISRHAHLRNGSDPSVIIGIDGVEDEGTLQRMSAKFNEKYAGPSKHGKAMFVNGQNVKVEPVTRTPAEMAYEGAFAQFRDAIMALHGVTPIAAGIEAPSGDDGLYAPLKQFVVGTVQPILDLMAEEDTEQLASQFGEGVSVLYTARAIDDAKLTEQQINTDIAAGAIEVDEIRKLRGRKPWGGEKGKAVAGQGAKEEPQQGLPGLAQGVPGLEPQTGSQALDPSKPPKGTPDPMKLAEEAVAKALGGFADRLSALLKSGDNCGTGAGGFQPGNDCAGGGEGGEKPTKKKRGKKVAEESSGPKIEVFERGTKELEFTSRGELIRGKLGEFPIIEGEQGLIGKLSKKTKAGIESAMADPDMVEDMKAGGIEALNIEPTNYYKKRTGRSGNWYGGYVDGALTIHPKTVDHIESSAVEERVGGGLRRLISHEAGHGVWDKARDADKKAFAEAVKKNPEIVAYVSSVTNVAANPNAFNDTGSRVVTESFAEIHALRRYNREMYDSLPEDIRSPIESARKFGLELSERRAGWLDRLKPKWQKSGSDCGANAEGGGGFQPGNTCGREDGSGESGGDGKASKKKPVKNGKAKGVLAWAEEKFGDAEKAKAFADWFGESKVIDEDGNPEETAPIPVYHGTTHDFEEFDLDRANVESDMGAGHYFSSDTGDSEANYAGEGPDLTSRIGSLADQLEGEFGDEYDVEDIAERLEIPSERVQEIIDGAEDDREVARELAREKLVGGEAKVITAYLKMEKPVVLGDPKWGKGSRPAEKGETFFDFEYDEMDSEGRRPDDPDFDPDTSEIQGYKGKLSELLDSVRNQAANYNEVGDGLEDDLAELQSTAADSGGFRAGELVSRLKSMESLAYATNDDGKLVSGTIVGHALRDIGFDGIVYKDAAQHFPNFGSSGDGKAIKPGTRHYVIWDSRQIKAANNQGTFDPSNPNIYKSGSSCGANAEGGGGFQPGNTCGREDGSGESGGGGKASKKKPGSKQGGKAVGDEIEISGGKYKVKQYDPKLPSRAGYPRKVAVLDGPDGKEYLLQQWKDGRWTLYAGRKTQETGGDDSWPMGDGKPATRSSSSKGVKEFEERISQHVGEVTLRGIEKETAGMLADSIERLYSDRPDLPKLKELKASTGGYVSDSVPAAMGTVGYGEKTTGTLFINSKTIGKDGSSERGIKETDDAFKVAKDALESGRIKDERMKSKAQHLTSFQYQGSYHKHGTKAIIEHELGHFIDKVLLMPDKERRDGLLAGYKEKARSVSARSWDNEAEYIAEVYAFHRMGEAVDNGFSDWFKELGL